MNMKKRWRKTGKTFLSMMLTAAVLAGCGASDKSVKTSDTGAGAESTDVVTLNILTTKISSNLSEYPDTHVMDAMADRIGVKINLIEADTDKYNVYIASGDGFDLVLTSTTYFDQLIQGGVVAPLDDMIEPYGDRKSVV